MLYLRRNELSPDSQQAPEGHSYDSSAQSNRCDVYVGTSPMIQAHLSRLFMDRPCTAVQHLCGAADYAECSANYRRSPRLAGEGRSA